MVNLKLKIAVIQPKQKKSKSSIVRQGNICEGIVIVDENGYYSVSISMKDDNKNPSLLYLDFTERSFDLKDKRIVYRKEKENGRFVRIIRSKEHAKFFPGLSEQYIPFVNGCHVKGYIVREEGVLKFDFKELAEVKSLILEEDEHTD